MTLDGQLQLSLFNERERYSLTLTRAEAKGLLTLAQKGGERLLYTDDKRQRNQRGDIDEMIAAVRAMGHLKDALEFPVVFLEPEATVVRRPAPSTRVALTPAPHPVSSFLLLAVLALLFLGVLALTFAPWQSPSADNAVGCLLSTMPSISRW